MPAAEAAVVDTQDELVSYEFAFHVLPTVAEGEVTTVFDSLKDIISKAGGQIFDEEAPERFDLAYEIVYHLEGKNRKFSSSYFGWIRFKLAADKLAELTALLDGKSELLRYLTVKLTKQEEENPFRFHEAMRDQKMVTNIEESDVIPDTEEAEASETESDKKEEGEVDEKELDNALENPEDLK